MTAITSSSNRPLSFFDAFAYALAYFAVISVLAAIDNLLPIPRIVPAVGGHSSLRYGEPLTGIFREARRSTRTLPLIITLNASEAIATLAALGFLGFGIEPTQAAEWGFDLNKSISDVAAGIWWTAVPPGIAIVLAVLGVTLIGESLNDLADPRLRARRRARAQTPADAVAATRPAAREDLGEVE